MEELFFAVAFMRWLGLWDCPFLQLIYYQYTI